MKRTQLKDALRNIKKQWVSYLSIVVIAALGVTMFLGIDYSAAAMRENGSEFYNSSSEYGASASARYSEVNYRDIEIVSTLMLSDGDIEVLRGVEGVRDVEGILCADVKASKDGVMMNASAVSTTERINIPSVIEGRLPESADECAVEEKLMESTGWKIGDRITLTAANAQLRLYLPVKEAVIVGTVIHPDHVNPTGPENSYILLNREAFDIEALKGSWMKAEIVIDKPDNINRFRKEYGALTKAVKDSIEGIAPERTALRYAEVKDRAEEYMSGHRQELDDALSKLEDARRQLDDGWTEYHSGEDKLKEGEEQLADARAQLDDAKAQLDEGREKLSDSRARLDEARAQLDDAKAQLDDAKAQLDEARAQLVSGWNALEDAKAQIRNVVRRGIETVLGGDSSEYISWAPRQSANPDDPNVSAMVFRFTGNLEFDLELSMNELLRRFFYSDALPDALLRRIFEELGMETAYDPIAVRIYLYEFTAEAAASHAEQYAQLQSGCSSWDSGRDRYLEGKAQYEEGLAQYEEGFAQYEDGEAQYAEGLAAFNEALARYGDGEEQYAQGLLDIEDARDKLAEALLKLEDGEAQYKNGLGLYEDGLERMSRAQKLVDGLVVECRWMVFDTHGNTSFVQYSASSDNLKSLEMTFSLLFVLVGALVIYATISKMVDEQRSLVGTTKALGFFNREIFAKYLSFGVSATLLGDIIGVIAAFFFVEGFVLNSYGLYYTFNFSKPILAPVPTLAVVGVSVLLAAGASWFACSRLIRTPVVRLMQQATPAGMKRSGKGRRALSLYSRLILLNMKTDIKRVAVTIVSIAGCCCLVVIGFTIKYSVNGAMKHQFDEIVRYDGLVRFDPDVGENTEERIGAVIEGAGAEAVPVANSFITIQITDIEPVNLFVGDIEGMSGMFSLNDFSTGEPLPMIRDGVYVPRRFSEIHGMKPGDRFDITINGTDTAEVGIAGIFANYISRYMFMSRECYDSLFEKPAVPNAYLVRLNGTSLEALEEALLGAEGYESFAPSNEYAKLFESATSVLNGIVLLFIFMAAVMAGVVLMNLTNIYIMQKKRELTIMRVNGFTVNEVIGYVLRETFVTTAVGIVLGMLLGSLAGYFIVRALEQPAMQLDRTICFYSWAIGAGITILFTVIINLIALRRVKDLKLTDL